MIRFTCDTCGRALRAPDALAGKKGKCARCGGVNRVPHTLSVEVKRAADPSPFRNVDRSVRTAIEGAIELSGKRFLATAPSATLEDERPADFSDQVASRMTHRPKLPEADRAPAVRVAPARRPPPPRPKAAPNPPNANVAPAAADVRIGYQINFETRPPDLTRAVWAALVVGAVVGFGSGLIVAKWLL